MNAIEKKIEENLKLPLSSCDYNIVRVKFIDTEHTRSILQIMIERQDNQPVSISDCEKATKLSSVVLDVENLLTSSYILEVSSPGIDRPLVKLSDYQKYTNHEVKINTFHEINGRKRFKAMLKAVNSNDDLELLLADEQVIIVPYTSISSGNLVGKVNINKNK